MIVKKTVPLSENDVFAIYRLPKSTDIILVQQKNKFLLKFDESLFKKEGFVFFPFDQSKNTPLFINADIVYKNTDFEFNTTKEFSSIDITKSEYTKKVAYFVENIKNEYRKIVLSRTKSIKNNNTNLHQLFLNLEQKYKNA